MVANVTQRTELGPLRALPTARHTRVVLRRSPWPGAVGAAHARRRVGPRLSVASSPRGFRLDLAVASRTYSKRSTGVASLDPERGNVKDCAVDGVLSRYSPAQSGVYGSSEPPLRTMKVGAVSSVTQRSKKSPLPKTLRRYVASTSRSEM